MSRVYFTSRQRIIQSEGMDPWEREDRSSFAGGSQSEIMIESLFDAGTCSWVMIVNGINKYVTEMAEETQEVHIDHIGDSTGELVAKARSKQTLVPTTSSPTVTSPYHQREWIDVELGGPYAKSCFEVSKR